MAGEGVINCLEFTGDPYGLELEGDTNCVEVEGDEVGEVLTWTGDG